MSKLGDNLRNLRENKGWSQKLVAQKLKIKQSSTYANWEYGIRDPDTETLDRLADLFGVTTDYLLGRTNNLKFDNDEKTEANRRRAEKFSKLPPERQEQILELMRDWIKEDSKS